ncbi:MAG: hypothetical protein V3R72_09425 [Gammaproteobacteria bacterium]
MILTKLIITAGTGLLMYTGAGCFDRQRHRDARECEYQYRQT